MPKNREFKDTEHFRTAFDAVAMELVCGQVYFDLFKKLDNAFLDHKYEISQSLTFWNITRELHLAAATISLCRVYDTDSKTNNLSLVLKTIQETTIADDLNVIESGVLAELDSEQLEHDIAFTDVRNESVRKLTAWRGNMFAHSNFEIATKTKEFQKTLQPFVQDFDLLLEKGLEIVNRYSQLLFQKEFHANLIGHQDYDFVMECIRIGLQQLDMERNAKLRGHGVNPDVFPRGLFQGD